MRIRSKNYLCAIFLMMYVSSAYAQTGIGSLSHIANSNAAETAATVAGITCGDYIFRSICTSDAGLDARCLRYLSLCGLDAGRASFHFVDGGAFAIVQGNVTVPGTWKTIGEKKIRLGFSKIFTYGIDAEVIEMPDSFLYLSVDRDDYSGLIQRIVSIIGRMDSNEIISNISNSVEKDGRIAIVLNK